MLADVGGHDRPAGSQLVYTVENGLHLQATLLAVLEWEFLLPVIDLRQPRRCLERLDHTNQLLEDLAGIPQHEDVRHDDLAELRRVDIDVDLLRVRAERLKFACDPVIPAATNGHDQITTDDGLVGIRRAVHAQHADRQPVLLGKGPLAQQRVGNRHLQLLSEGFGRHMRTRCDRPAADVEQGTVAVAQQLGRLFESDRVCFGAHRVTRQVDTLGKGRVTLSRSHILWQVDQHRPLAPCIGDVESLHHHTRDVVGVLHQIGVLDDGYRNAKHVGFLERVLAKHGGDRLPREHDHRHRVHLCRQQARDRVCRTRAGGDEDNAGLAGGSRIPVGHVCGALFMPRQYELDLLGVEQGVENRHGRAARVTENVFDPLAFQGFNDSVSASHDG